MANELEAYKAIKKMVREWNKDADADSVEVLEAIGVIMDKQEGKYGGWK